MDDFDIAQNRMGMSARRVLDCAAVECRRRDHMFLTNGHIFLAFALFEWDTFSHVMHHVELNPNKILRGLRHCQASQSLARASASPAHTHLLDGGPHAQTWLPGS